MLYKFRNSQQGIVRGNLMITILILAVLAGLFFIPEILNLKKGYSFFEGWFSDRPTEVSAIEKPASPFKQLDNRARNLSPLEIVLSEMKVSASQGDEAKARLDTSGLSQEDPRSLAAGVISKKSISWETLESRQVVRIFRDNRNQLAVLLRSIDSNKPGTKTAIRNMINGIDYILDGAENEMTALAAIDYLSSLDRKIETEMLREKISRDVYIKWEKLSFGPLFKQTSLDRKKTHLAFRPMFTLGRLRVIQPIDSSGQIDPKQEPVIDLEPYVKGQDVKEVVIYRNNMRIKTSLPSIQENELGYRKLGLRQMPATGIYRFEIYDHFGEVVIKRYEFFNKALRFRSSSRTGEIQLPFGFGLKDKNLDRYFSLGMQSTSRSTAFASAGQSRLFTVF
ncbi:MAG: hypothetical protein R3A13_09715 [Bdellovibrionota bacterium]